MLRAKKVVTSIYKVVGQMFIAAGSGFSDWTRTTISLERN